MKLGRDWAVPLLVGLALVGFYALRPSKTRPVKTAAPAPAPVAPASTGLISVRPVATPAEAGWSEYDVVLPSGKWECRTSVLVDGRGGYASIAPVAGGPQPSRLRFRLGTDLDSDVKAILKAQGLPVKENVMTYKAEFGLGGSGMSFSRSVTFARGAPGGTLSRVGPTQTEFQPGDRITLLDTVYADEQFPIPSYPGPLDYPNDSTFAAHFPPNRVHRITGQVLFVPAHG